MKSVLRDTTQNTCSYRGHTTELQLSLYEKVYFEIQLNYYFKLLKATATDQVSSIILNTFQQDQVAMHYSVLFLVILKALKWFEKQTMNQSSIYTEWLILAENILNSA